MARGGAAILHLHLELLIAAAEGHVLVASRAVLSDGWGSTRGARKPVARDEFARAAPFQRRQKKKEHVCASRFESAMTAGVLTYTGKSTVSLPRYTARCALSTLLNGA